MGKISLRRCRSVVGALAMAAAVVASAQSHQATDPPAKAAPGVTLTADLVKTGLYLIRGGGANTLLRFSANGLILVDGKLPGNYRALMSQVRKINKLSDMPIRALIVTNHREEHAGNSAQFVASGVPIVAHENVQRNLRVNDSSGQAVALPTVTYKRDYSIKLGGVEVRLMHFGNARTDGDTVVYFPDLKVVAVGDLYTTETPAPDFAKGGSLVDWGGALAEILKLDFDVVVPSVGPPVTRSDLEAFRKKIDTVVSRANGLMKAGIAKDQLMGKLQTDDLGWRFDLTADQVDRFYAELLQSK